MALWLFLFHFMWIKLTERGKPELFQKLEKIRIKLSGWIIIQNQSGQEIALKNNKPLKIRKIRIKLSGQEIALKNNKPKQPEEYKCKIFGL